MKSIIGHRFGNLLVLRELEKVDNQRIVYVKCDCGTEKKINLNNLISGKTVSCGCFRNKRTRETCITHGLRHHHLYKIWAGIKSRCQNPNEPCYNRYGGRGIMVCDEWKNDFLSFYNWAIPNGYMKGLQIDRINNNGNYEPNNCRFVTPKQNARNKRNNIILELNGQKKTLSEWAELYNINIYTLYYRIVEAGMTLAEALSFSKKLDDETVLKIYHSNKSPIIIARELGLNPSRVCDIKNGKSYSHITGAIRRIKNIT